MHALAEAPPASAARTTPSGDVVLDHVIRGATLDATLSCNHVGGTKTTTIDTAAVAFADTGAVLDVACLRRPRALGQTVVKVKHDSAAASPSASLFVHLSRLPRNVKALVLLASCVDGGSLANVNACTLLLSQTVGDGTPTVLASFDFPTVPVLHEPSLVLGLLFRDSANGGKWTARPSGEPCFGFSAFDCLESCRACVDPALEPTKKQDKMLDLESSTMSLQKGELVTVPAEASVLHVAFGWVVPSTLEIDASAVVLGKRKEGVRTLIDCIWYQHDATSPPYVRHSTEETLQGEVEVMIIDLQAVPREVEEIVFPINIFTSGGSFRQCRNCFVGLRGPDTRGEPGKPVPYAAKFQLTSAVHTRALVFGKLMRCGDQWVFKSMAVGCEGATAKAKPTMDVVTQKIPGVDLQVDRQANFQPRRAGSCCPCLTS